MSETPALVPAGRSLLTTRRRPPSFTPTPVKWHRGVVAQGLFGARQSHSIEDGPEADRLVSETRPLDRVGEPESLLHASASLWLLGEKLMESFLCVLQRSGVSVRYPKWTLKNGRATSLARCRRWLLFTVSDVSAPSF